jgi:hypothetical protein
MGSRSRVKIVPSAQIEHAVTVLCDAFHDYPVMRYVLGPLVDYDYRLRTLIGFFVRSLGLFVAAMACSSPVAVPGTYELRAVNGTRLPVRASSHSRGSADIVGGSITLNTDGSYRRRQIFRVRFDTLTYTDSAVHVGRYVPKGATFLLETPSGSMHGRVSDARLTVDLEGWRYQYHLIRADSLER